MCQELPQRDPILNTNGVDINLMGPQNQITSWLDKGAGSVMDAMDFLTMIKPFSFPMFYVLYVVYLYIYFY